MQNIVNIKNLTTEVLLEHRRQELKNISRYNNLQLAKKVTLNSAYGALG